MSSRETGAGPGRPPPDQDLTAHPDGVLARDVAAGDLDAWHRFLLRYSELIMTTLARHLPAEDEDAIRGVYVDLLRRLYRGELAGYRPPAALPAWLSVYSRRRAMDFLRSKYGRYRAPIGIRELGRFEQRVYQLYYVERLGLDIVCHAIRWTDPRVGPDDIARAISRIEAVIDPRLRERLNAQHLARKNGIPSARELKHLVRLRTEYQELLTGKPPDAGLLEAEGRALAARVRQLMDELPPAEKRIVELRFERGLAAREIDEELQLGGRRRVYTILERVIRRFRAVLRHEREHPARRRSEDEANR